VVSNAWLHFPFSGSFVGWVQKQEENPTFGEFLFSGSFSLFSSSFGKCEKGTPSLRKIEGKGKASQTFAFSCRLTNAGHSWQSTQNCFKLLFTSPQASSQQHKQTKHCWLATSPSTWLMALWQHSLSLTPWCCQVGWSHSIQTIKNTCTICWSLCSWINNVDDLLNSKVFKLFRSESCFLHQEQEIEENALSHASSFSSRNKELGNRVQKERKWRKTGIP